VKVVLDSNIYVSAFLFDRDPERIIDFGIAGKFKLYSSLYIIEEVKRVLHEKLGTSERFAVLSGKRIERYSSVIPIRGGLGLNDPTPIDPKDGPVIKTCLASKADVLVTGDKELSSLNVRGTVILGPTMFLRHLTAQGVI
jgi:putative PIN family toxin of toxin-antitoxin system